jgi:hypothetical protein
MHECLDKIFKGSIERRSLIASMSGVILVIDELIDQGILMHTSSKIILARIKTSSSGSNSKSSSSSTAPEEAPQSSLFSSVFSSARS